ncbi:MAG: PfkB family carbohydrate kinase [Elusimicrobiota bacterium]|jgi:sugar/nucleoside kinase (ribokinase family)
MSPKETVVVVGSVALDSVQTPSGESREALGGSAVYFSLAARHFARVSMVGVVGEDFPSEHRQMLTSHGVDTAGLQAVPGRTFRWVGRFGRNLNNAKTLDTQLNVFESFRPALVPEQRDAEAVFLANIDPDLQAEVLSQMNSPRLVACDTMNFWISKKRAALRKLLKRVHVFFVNEEEARKLSRQSNNVRAARTLASWGPSVVVVKMGEHGSLLLAAGRVYPFPAFPLDTVKDPTGAGDSFGGAFLGSLVASRANFDNVAALKRSMVYGTVTASFNVSDFSTKRLEALDLPTLEERFREYAELLRVQDPDLTAAC